MGSGPWSLSLHWELGLRRGGEAVREELAGYCPGSQAWGQGLVPPPATGGTLPRGPTSLNLCFLIGQVGIASPLEKP